MRRPFVARQGTLTVAAGPAGRELTIAGERAAALDSARRERSGNLHARAQAMLPAAMADELAAIHANVSRTTARLRRLSAGDVAS